MKLFGMTLSAALALVMMSTAYAAEGTIYKTAGGRVTGEIRWKNSAREYAVTNAKGMTVTLPADDVERIDMVRPAKLDAAIRGVKAGGSKMSSAIADLEKIAKEYSHLTFDREASSWLAQAYLKQGNASKAVSVCETVIRGDAEAAYMGPMAVTYWDALIKDGKASKLRLHLDKAIASGDSVAAANALVARGNEIMARGASRANCEEALRDGYLRVILLYADTSTDASTDAFAQALYMGAKAFDGMGQGNRANKLRATLKAECAASSWARR